MWLQEEQRALQGEGTREEAALTEVRSTVLSEAQLRTRLEQAATEEQVEMCAPPRHGSRHCRCSHSLSVRCSIIQNWDLTLSMAT